MPKSPFAIICLLLVLLASLVPAQNPSYSALADTLLQRAQAEVDRIKTLVDSGVLPRARLAEAEEHLADTQDQDTLARTLYSSTPVEKMTEADANTMLDAAERRVERQQKAVERYQQLLQDGIVAPVDLEAGQNELESRRQVLRLADSRSKLLADLKQMAEREREAELRAQAGTLQTSMIRFAGSGAFDLTEFPALSARFQRRFGHALPVSAMGQTHVHTELGLDHSNRVDIALNPESNEGLWFRRLLEQLKIPYLAFRAAIAGAATGPHIHLGTGSARLKLAGR